MLTIVPFTAQCLFDLGFKDSLAMILFNHFQHCCPDLMGTHTLRDEKEDEQFRYLPSQPPFTGPLHIHLKYFLRKLGKKK